MTDTASQKSTGHLGSLLDFGQLNISVIIVSLVTIWVVHRLTRSREREKHVFDLCRTVETAAKDLSDLAFTAWADEPSPERARAVAQVRSQLQLIGALANRLEILTEGWRLRYSFTGPGAVNAKIALGSSLKLLRQSITADPFDEPKRKSDLEKAISCTSDSSLFILSLDLALRNWIKPF